MFLSKLRPSAASPRSLELPEMQITPRRHDTLIVLAFAATLHLILFAFDVVMQFPAFLRGDRSLTRWSALEALRSAEPSHVMQALTSGPTVPGEYIFGYALNLVGGPEAIIAFQILLFLLSLACLCKIAEIFPWRYSVVVLGTIYTLLPHNLVFPHQFVTEAIATPFIVFFVYFYYRFTRSLRSRDALLCGLSLGIAIFVRPPLLPVVPLLFLVRLVYKRYFPENSLRTTLLIFGVALIPMALWTTTYTLHTGHFGYTSGVANLAWNLRSKVFLVYSRNELEQPPPLSEFKSYPRLYDDNNGISVTEFLGIASQHPVLFIQAAVSDALIFLGRGDISKVFIDYLGDPDTATFKAWRSWASKSGLQAALDLLSKNPDALFLILAEMVLSLLTLTCTLTALAFAGYCMVRPRRISDWLGKEDFTLALILSSVLIAVFSSAQLVDQAQGRLRNPAEACIMLLLGLAFWYSSMRTKHGKPSEASTSSG